MIRAAHAKEKQLLENSRNRPNRLNLLDSTACSRARSNFFTKNPCLVRFPVFQGLNEATDAIALQKIWLYKGRNLGRFVAHLLKKRLEFTFFQGCYQGGIIGLDSQIIDRHR